MAEGFLRSPALQGRQVGLRRDGCCGPWQRRRGTIGSGQANRPLSRPATVRRPPSRGGAVCAAARRGSRCRLPYAERPPCGSKGCASGAGVWLASRDVGGCVLTTAGSTRKEHSTPAGRRIRSLAYPSSIDHSPSRIDPAFAYFRLRTEQHGNLPMWREALALQAERLRDAMPDGRTLDADAHFALVAIRQGLRLVEVVQSYVDDEALGRALDEH